MKVKTSITLSEELLAELEVVGKGSNRSRLIEEAVREYLVSRRHAAREARDLAIINRHHVALNKEAKDVLSFQVER